MHLPSNTGVYEHHGSGQDWECLTPHHQCSYSTQERLVHAHMVQYTGSSNLYADTRQLVSLWGEKSLQPKPQSQLLFCKTAIIHPLKDQIVRKCIKPHPESHDSTACHSLMGALQKRSWTTCANLNHPTSGLSTFCSPLAVTSYNPTFSNKTFLTKTS